ncbi:hypothetical protein [Solidesulfovibrio carbinolicus]|uniref:Uncharacterized protein n=1 Tax=Solidesulfovibrio carbinolicus TaxID=296842 RepID=A0A4P6HHM4_9BACT|nr:hypothetical protein [Solidesulfovibrio carbinolicus]QAZ65986.1 hypothetical protein C3Y92_01505 [Solidesulfovibrio carbinolicus]
MLDPVYFSDTAENLGSLRATHRDQEKNLHYLRELLEEIKLRFVRLDNGLADFQTIVASLGRDKAELAGSRRTVRAARPPRLPLPPRRPEIAAALAGQSSRHIPSAVR